MRKLAYLLSLALIFMIPWEDVVNVPGLGTATRFIGLGVAAFWVAMVVVRGQLRTPNRFHVVAWLFILWNACTAFWSGDTIRTVSQLVTWVQLLGLALIIWDLYSTPAAIQTGLQMYVIGAYVVFANTLKDYAAGSSSYFERFSATGTNPDDLALVLILGIPVASYLAASSTASKLGGARKIVNYAYIPAAFVGVVLSGTRSALIAAVPGMLFALASLTRLKLWVRIAVVMLLVAAVVALLPFVQTLASFERLSGTATELSRGDLNGRIPIWQDGLASFARHPLLGIGGNMFRSINRVNKVAHNSYLSILVETGLVGFTLFGMMLAMAVVAALRHSKWDAGFWLSVLAVWAVGAFALTWEYRKPTWLFLSLVIASSGQVQQTARATYASLRDRFAAPRASPSTMPGAIGAEGEIRA